MATSGSRILIIGATGYIGRYIAKASLDSGHPTFLLVRKFTSTSNHEKAKLLESFKISGANILYGSLEDHASLVDAIKKVDVVISAVGCFQLMSQLNIIKAIKEVGTIKRFLPAEFGFEYDKIYDTEMPATTIVEDTVKIRRAIEAEGIPHTYVISNCFAWYFVPSLGYLGTIPPPPRDKIVIYGDGNSKASFTKEEDVGTITIKAVDDPRTLNKSLHFMFPANTMSVNELVGLWEKMIVKTLEKVYVPEEGLRREIAEAPSKDVKFDLACYHFIFIRGDLRNIEIGPHGVEVSQLYPDVKYTTAEEYLRQYV